MNTKVTVITFITLLFSLSMLNLLMPDRSFSESENRYLQGLPEFTSERLWNGSYTSEFDQYITDQFFFRDSWVGMKTLSELALQKKTSSGVYFADDGYLIEMFDTFDREQFERNLNTVGDFSQRVEGELGVRVDTMLVPTASMILKEKLPAFAPEVNQRELLDQAELALPHLVDVSDVLRAHREEPIYFHTDHHWTSQGAALAYRVYRESIGESVDSQYTEEELSDCFYGTTYSKASLYTLPPDSLSALVPDPPVQVQVDYHNGEKPSDSIYERAFLDVKDKYSVFLNSNQPMTSIKTDNANGRRLLLVKDSYANAFVQLLLPDYEEIVVLDLRYYKHSPYDFIQENSITDVLLLYSLKGFVADTNLYYFST